MSPESGFVLMDKIAPRLRKIVPHLVKPVGTEDLEELLQDALVIAAQMLDSVERQSKSVTPGNICHYVGLHLKSGRRSYGGGRTDALGNGAQLDGNSRTVSFDEPVGDPETGEEIPLGELLSGSQDDPSQCAMRNLDWGNFLAQSNPSYLRMIETMLAGGTMRDIAKESGLSDSSLSARKRRLTQDVEEFFGTSAIADAARTPSWRGNIMANHERAACKADRRHR